MSAQTKSTGPSWPPELYARARPSYPEEVVEKVVKSPSSNEPLNIVELGAGTGIATKVIIEACSGPSAHARLASYTALDASSAMMEALERSLMQAPDGLVPRLKQSGLLGADVTTDTGVATFEDFNSAQRFTGQVDLILIAQAWHWCQDWDKALCNFAKALKPGGTLALLWNLEDKDAGEPHGFAMLERSLKSTRATFLNIVTLAGTPCTSNLGLRISRCYQKCISLARFPPRSRASARVSGARATFLSCPTTSGRKSKQKLRHFFVRPMPEFPGSTKTKASLNTPTRPLFTFSDEGLMLEGGSLPPRH